MPPQLSASTPNKHHVTHACVSVGIHLAAARCQDTMTKMSSRTKPLMAHGVLLGGTQSSHLTSHFGTGVCLPHPTWAPRLTESALASPARVSSDWLVAGWNAVISARKSHMFDQKTIWYQVGTGARRREKAPVSAALKRAPQPGPWETCFRK